MSKGHKFTNIPEIPNASPTSSSPARHPLVRSQPAPRNQHRALKRPSLLTIAPRHQHLVRKTALPAHDRPPTPALVRKTALPAHDRPPTSAASAISKMQPSVCVNNHGSQLILHEYIKRTSSHPESDRRTCILLTDCLELRLHKQITQPCRLNQERQRSCARKASSSRHGLVRGTFLDRTHLASRRRPCGQRRSWRDGSQSRC